MNHDLTNRNIIPKKISFNRTPKVSAYEQEILDLYKNPANRELSTKRIEGINKFESSLKNLPWVLQTIPEKQLASSIETKGKNALERHLRELCISKEFDLNPTADDATLRPRLLSLNYDGILSEVNNYFTDQILDAKNNIVLKCDENDPVLQLKTEALKEAIDKVRTMGYKLENITFYLHGEPGASLAVPTKVDANCEIKESAIVLSRAAGQSPSSRQFGGLFLEKFNNSRRALKHAIKTNIVHELGHLIHASYSPGHFYAVTTRELAGAEHLSDEKCFKEAKGFQFDILCVQEEKSLLSSYSKERPIEFVAEVFAGTTMGLEFPHEVMDVYRKLGGPPTKK